MHRKRSGGILATQDDSRTSRQIAPVEFLRWRVEKIKGRGLKRRFSRLSFTRRARHVQVKR